MPSQTCVVDNRVFLLGLDELYRRRMKAHERDELRQVALRLCQVLGAPPHAGPVEGYYAEDERLTGYFRCMRALQDVRETARPVVQDLPEFRRLRDVTSAPLFGKPVFGDKLLPMGNDPLTIALEATFPAWSVDEVASAAFSVVQSSDDFSLVGLAAFAKDPVVLASLRETAVLYARVAVGCAPGVVTLKYEWAVDPMLAERAIRFVSTFNALFKETLPAPTPTNAAAYWDAADESKIYGRCVRIGYDNSKSPIQKYHWAVVPRSGGLTVGDFWSVDLWTTERFRNALSGREAPPFPFGGRTLS